MTRTKKTKARPLSVVICERCNLEVERLSMRSSEPGSLEFVAECHGERQTIVVHEHELAGKKFTGGSAFGANPRIDIKPFGEGY